MYCAGKLTVYSVPSCSSPVTVWSLSWSVALGDLAVLQLARVAIERDLLGLVALGERTEPEEGREHGGHDDDDDQAAALLGHGHSERREDGRANLLLVRRPFSGRAVRRSDRLGPAYSAM